MPERIEIYEYVPHDQVSRWDGAFRDHLRRYYYAATILAHSLDRHSLVLDLPCGNGYGSEIIRRVCLDVQRYAPVLIGVDIDQQTVMAAQENFPQVYEFMVGDMTFLDIRSMRMDAVVSFEGIEHVEDSEQAVSEMYRVLAPGAHLIASIPREAGLNEWHKRCFPTVASIRALFDPIFGRDYYTIGTQFNADRDSEIIAHLERDCLDAVDDAGYWIINAWRP